MAQRVWVTGSGGVLGMGFQRVLESTPQYELVFSSQDDCDLTDAAATFQAMKRAQVEAVIHLAAISGGIVLSRKYPATLLRDNVLMSISILEAARRLGVKKVVMTLSGGMYPPSAPIPIPESSIHSGPAHESNYSYAYAKRLIEPAIQAYRQEFGLNAIGLVPNGIFGPGDSFTGEGTTFIAALLQRFYENRNNESKIVIWGDGSARREVTFCEDMARAFLWCFSHYEGSEILNVGTSEEHSIRETAFLIAEEMGVSPDRILFDAGKPSGISRRGLDNSRFLALSHFQFTPFREGLRKTIRWMREQERSVERSPGERAPVRR